MHSVRNWIGVGATALVAGALTFATTAGFAMPRYDGLWSVSIVTTKGDCIASYRYPMRIANGILPMAATSRSTSPAELAVTAL